MASKDNGSTGSPGDGSPLTGKAITRRDFMKVAGTTGAVVAGAGGLSSFLAACGKSSGGGSSSGSGRTIKVGFVTPLTGPLAAFGESDQFLVSQWKAAVKGGVKCGDGQTHPVEIIVKDSQSDSNRAATVAGDLVTNDGIDIMMVASTPDTVNPVADQAEALGVPCVSNDCPWQPYYFGRGATPTKPFKWTYHAFWGLEDVTAVFTGMWNQIPTNKLVGEMWPNDADGLGWANAKTGQPPLLTAAGYKFIDGGRFQDGTQDYTSQITKFKSGGAQILSGVFIPPDFVNFWKQSYQQGFKPKVASVGKALLFPAELESIGPIGYGLTTEVWWSPWHPFKSSLSGQTTQDLCNAWTASNGKEWTQPLLHYAVFEVVVDALKRATNVDSKENHPGGHQEDRPRRPSRDTSPGRPERRSIRSRTSAARSSWAACGSRAPTYPFDLKLVDTSHAAAAPFNVTIPQNGKLVAIKY